MSITDTICLVYSRSHFPMGVVFPVPSGTPGNLACLGRGEELVVTTIELEQRMEHNSLDVTKGEWSVIK